MVNSVQEQEKEYEGALYRHRWLAIPLWVVGVVVVGWCGFGLLAWAGMATANGEHPWDGPLISTAMTLLYAAFPVSLFHLMLVLIGRDVRRVGRVVGVLLITMLVIAFAAFFLSAGLDPV